MNTIYFDQASGGFFHAAFHGQRMIAVVDEEAQQTAMHAAIELDGADYQAALAALNEGDLEPSAKDFNTRLLSVIADPVMKMAPNPDCRIPKEAIEISQEQYDTLMAAQNKGQQIIAGKNGNPVAADRTLDSNQIVPLVRARRDRLLAACDWTQANDSPLNAEQKALWGQYRDALRTLPATIEAMKPADLRKITNTADLFPSPPS
jgi:hypothetical protein